MRSTRLAMMSAAVGALVAIPAAQAATVKNGSPNLATYRGKALAVVFFHPF